MADKNETNDAIEEFIKDKKRKQDLSIQLETIDDEELLKLIEELLRDPLF
ncbi:MAG: hypothetical protein ACYC5K_10785 [Saccharofermentanales bacterium]